MRSTTPCGNSRVAEPTASLAIVMQSLMPIPARAKVSLLLGACYDSNVDVADYVDREGNRHRMSVSLRILASERRWMQSVAAVEIGRTHPEMET